MTASIPFLVMGDFKKVNLGSCDVAAGKKVDNLISTIDYNGHRSMEMW